MRKHRNFSINTKAFLGIFLLLSGICGIVYAVLIVNLPATVARKQNTEMMDELYDAVFDSSSYISLTNIESSLKPLAEEYQINITVSDSAENKTVSIKGIPENQAGEAQKLDVGISYMNSSLSSLYQVDIWSASNNEIRIRDVLISQIPIIFCIVFGLSLGSSFLVARIITKPIVKISETSKQLANSTKATIPYLKRKDEIGALANNLSNMYDNLQESLSNEHHQMLMRDKLFQSVSHELKTPITILQGELEGMIYSMGDYKDRDTYLQHSLEVTQDMAALVNKILMLSKSNTTYAKEKQDLSQLIFTQCERYTALANQKSIDLLCEAEDEVMAYIDTEAFGRAISNLLSNAIKYSPVGATVIAHVEEHLIFVENSGVFLPEEKLDDLFEPFVRLEESHNHELGGSGLGLYIVKTILHAHNMEYTLENTDTGVRFTIRF